tara:strand:+ start:107 stop:499 length:393 start_codon:yes stop_codon:yes gene_type:complete
MNTENRVFETLFKEEKTNLSTQKIELSIVDDINNLASRMDIVSRDISKSNQISDGISKERNKVITDLKVSARVAEKYISESNKIITNAKKIAKEFGAPVTDLKGYKSLEKSISTLSRYIDIASGAVKSLS